MSSSQRRAERLAYTLVGVVAALVGLVGIGSWDLWWHLATGRLALETGSTLPTDPFSLTQPGAPWVYKDLGSEVLLYAVYDALGVAGLVAVKLLLALALGALLIVLVRRRCRAVWVLLALPGLALVVASFRVIMRPEAFTHVALAGLLVLLDVWRRSPAPRGTGRGLAVPAALIAVMAAWANLHRGVVLGAALLVGFALYELASALERHVGRGGRWLPSVVTVTDRPFWEAGKTALMAVMGLAATLLNPSGTALWTQSLAVGTSQTLPVAVSEWAGLSIGELWSSFPVTVVWMAAVVIVVPLAWWRTVTRGGDVDPWDVALTAVGLVLGLDVVRFLPTMAILTAGPMAGALGTLWGYREAERPRALPAALAAVGLIVVVWIDPRLAESGPGLRRGWYPEAAVELIAEVPVAGQGYTAYSFAGYVLYHLWPDKRVVCDGRYDTVYDDDVLARCLMGQQDPTIFSELVDRYELEWVLASNWPEARPPFAWLDRDPAWALVHWDAASLLYVRRGGPNGDLAAVRAYGVLRPRDLVASLRQGLDAARGNRLRGAQLEAEIRRLQEAAPDDYRTYVVLALYLHELGATGSEEYRLIVEGLRARRDDDPAAVDQVLGWIGED